MPNGYFKHETVVKAGTSYSYGNVGSTTNYISKSFEGVNLSNNNPIRKGRRSSSPWRMWKQTITHTPQSVTLQDGWSPSNNAYVAEYKGVQFCNPTYLPGAPPGWNNLDTLYDELNAIGLDLYNKAKPAKPEIELAVSTIELREIPAMLAQIRAGLNPRLWKRISFFSQGFLLYQFGIKPMISDVQGILKLSSALNKHITQLQKDDNKWIRRKRSLPSTDTVNPSFTITDIKPLRPVFTTRFYNGDGHMVVTNRVKVETWFVGHFRYILPKMPPNNQRALLMRRLAGFQVKPSVLYNAIPWTWLADWFSTLGDYIEAHETIADRIVSRNACVMRKYVETSQSTGVQPYKGGSTCTASVTLTRTTKLRRSASSFGFGVSGNSLTPMQKAILGALSLPRKI